MSERWERCPPGRKDLEVGACSLRTEWVRGGSGSGQDTLFSEWVDRVHVLLSEVSSSVSLLFCE